MIYVPETIMERRTVKAQQVRYDQQPGTLTVYELVTHLEQKTEQARVQQMPNASFVNCKFAEL